MATLISSLDISTTNVEHILIIVSHIVLWLTWVVFGSTDVSKKRFEQHRCAPFGRYFVCVAEIANQDMTEKKIMPAGRKLTQGWSRPFLRIRVSILGREACQPQNDDAHNKVVSTLTRDWSRPILSIGENQDYPSAIIAEGYMYKKI